MRGRIITKGQEKTFWCDKLLILIVMTTSWAYTQKITQLYTLNMCMYATCIAIIPQQS